ncbi:MAG: o-succinylbenzoate synthase [Phycisphaerales bacterium]|nr:o-succinylbenzoate synthase [Phycisphaerales bacterium]
MTIDRIDIHRVAMPLIYPFRTAFGNDECIESVLVKLTSDDGLCGWGESAAWRNPAYCAEWARGMFLLIRERLAPLMIGQTIESGDELQRLLLPIRDNRFSKAVIDLAWWDLNARSRNQPLWKTLGGAGPVVAVGADLGVMESIDALLSEIGKAIEEGFQRIKLKYRPGWEIDVIAAVRKAFPTTVFHVDCNSAYTLADLPMLKKLDDFNLAMIEQPLMHDDLIDHATLAKALDTPICLDESITSPEKARQAVEIGACRWINIKHGRVGGITNALKIHDIARAAGVGCWVGGMLESSVGQSFAIALASLSNIHYPADIFPTSRFYHRDLGRRTIDLCGPSQISAVDGPGIGVVPDEQMLVQCTLEQATLTSRGTDRMRN